MVLIISSGYPAFRVGGFILADHFRLPQSLVLNRIKLARPLFAAFLALNAIRFRVIFGWLNQTLAAGSTRRWPRSADARLQDAADQVADDQATGHAPEQQGLGVQE